MLPHVPWPHLEHLLVRNIPLVLFFAINGLVLYNVIAHPPTVGYDAGSHLGYILTLAEGRLPTPYDTSEFFSPPLPYALPALAYASGLSWELTTKLAQVLNVVASLGTVFVLMRLAQLIRPGKWRYVSATLAVLALLPVYYKSFAFIRGEVWVTLFTVLTAYEVVALSATEYERKQWAIRAIRLGLWLGLAVLARQWGFMVWAAVVFYFAGSWWQRKRAQARGGPAAGEIRGEPRQMLQAALISGAVALVIGGWFYLHLQGRYDSVAAFNRSLQPTFSLANNPASFYSGRGNGKLFSDPVRPSFPNELWPKFYAEFWGDYEAYFLVYGRDLRTNTFLPGHFLEEALADGAPWLATNRAEMAVYLGRVNWIALGLSALLAGGLLYGSLFFWRWLRGSQRGRLSRAYAFIFLLISAAVLGYSAFLIMVPNPGNGDTIKATYLLHIYPLLALFAAELMEGIGKRTRFGYGLMWVMLVVTAVFVAPTLLTRYVG
jgi:hypothetical protein